MLAIHIQQVRKHLVDILYLQHQQMQLVNILHQI